MTRKIAGVVLAGGQSSRMGQDKAFLEYKGQPLLNHMMDILKQSGVTDIYISGEREGYHCLVDRAPHNGPAWAMCDVLRSLKSKGYDGVIFVPVDMPFLNAEMLKMLIAQDNGAAFTGSPLPACIAGACPKEYPKSVGDLLKKMDTPWLSLPNEFEHCMRNANTPDDWKKVQMS